jgi:hypothetical protein
VSKPRNATAHEVERDAADLNVGQPGAYYFVYNSDGPEPERPIGVLHGCPCGCGGRSLLFFAGRGGHGARNGR